MFPVDKPISQSKLIRLWIAEGFISPRQEKTLEEVGEEYLIDLMQRNLVQVKTPDISYGKAQKCRVHDLIYDIILSRSEELGLHQVSVDNHTIIKGIGRRLSILDRADNNLSECSSNVKTSSLLFFCGNELPYSFKRRIFTSWKLLKVLDFEGAPLDNIPEELGNLRHLSYLSLKDTKVHMLPRSIGKLINLETLDLRECPLYNLLIKVNRLLKLRYLVAHYYNASQGLKIHGSIRGLNALIKLRHIEVDDNIGLIKDLECLTQLRTLGIIKLKQEYGSLLCNALQNMNNLHSLSVASLNEEEVLSLQSMIDPPPLLQHLYLYGTLVEMPHWISKLKNLVKIKLYFSNLEDDPLNVLQVLPNLETMRLLKTCNGEILHFKKESFQKFKYLDLLELDKLKMVIIEEGALPSLVSFWFGQVPELREVSSGIHQLRNLKTLSFWDIRRELALGLLPNGGRDYWKIKHVPDVRFVFTIEARHIGYKLGDMALLEYLR